ncbi:TPA: hypothetical protein ACYSED_005339, partial [Citrobacter freundii]
NALYRLAEKNRAYAVDFILFLSIAKLVFIRYYTSIPTGRVTITNIFSKQQDVEIYDKTPCLLVL